MMSLDVTALFAIAPLQFVLDNLSKNTIKVCLNATLSPPHPHPSIALERFRLYQVKCWK